MNLHGIAAPYVGVVNPSVPVTIRISSGSTISDDGTRIPTYSTASAQAQIQALQFRDLVAIQGLNLQGLRRAIYLSGDIEGIVRSKGKGGDLVTFPDGTVWLVAMVLETWPDWCKVAATLQQPGT